MYKAIFIDIDGTLKKEDKTISQRTINSIKNICSLGVYIVLSTGRTRRSAEQISRGCGASKYIVTSGGAEIYDYEEDKVIYSNNMSIYACEQLYNLAKAYDTRFIMSVGDVRVVNKLKHMDGSEVLLTENIKDFLSKNMPLQCVISDSNFNKIKNMREHIEKIAGIKINNQSKSLMDSSIEPSGKIEYDITNFDTSKGTTIKEFYKYLDISISDTVGIGDDYNDISMFEVAGHSVAMGNANDMIKKMVKEVIKSNDEDGLAEYLECLYSKYTYIKK